MKKRQGVILKTTIFLIFVGILWGIISGSITSALLPHNDLTNNNPVLGEYFNSLKYEVSDIANMSKYDKFVMGLSIEDGSDSDNDGLTDKEELEIYNSDPTKLSTAGDLYTDGYKVNFGAT